MHTTFVHCLNRSFDALEKAKKSILRGGKANENKTHYGNAAHSNVVADPCAGSGGLIRSMYIL